MPPRKKAEPKAKRDCKFHCCAVSDERKAEISESIKEPNVPMYGPACRCGIRRNPVQIGFGIDDGSCPRHGERTDHG